MTRPEDRLIPDPSLKQNPKTTPVVCVSHALRGWIWYLMSPDKDGIWEPDYSSCLSFATEAEARADGKAHADCEGYLCSWEMQK
jgi:hypothetical protein